MSVTMFEKIIKESDKKCAGEYSNKKIFLAALGTFYIKNQPGGYPLHILVGGPSRGGKDVLVKSFSEQMGGKCFKIAGQVTAKSFIYDTEISDYSKTLFYIPDASAQLLDDSVMANIMTEGTSAQFTDPNKMETVKIKDKGIPYIIATTSRSFDREDVLNRFIPLTIDTSEQQTRDIHRMQKRILLRPAVLQKNLEGFDKIKVDIPFVGKILDGFPTHHIVFREKSLQMIKLLMGITTINHQGEKVAIPDKDDYKIFESVAASVSAQGLIGLSSSQKEHYDLIGKITLNGQKKLVNEHKDFYAQDIYDHSEYLYSATRFYRVLNQLRGRKLIIQTGRELQEYGKPKAKFKLIDITDYRIPTWDEVST